MSARTSNNAQAVLGKSGDILTPRLVEHVIAGVRETLDPRIAIIEDDRRGFHFNGAVKTGGFLLGIVAGNELGVPGQN